MVQDQVMMKALHAKFTQHENLKQLLLGTEDKTLVFESENDSYWGSGKDNTGRNQLGNCLMQLRHSLKKI